MHEADRAKRVRRAERLVVAPRALPAVSRRADRLAFPGSGSGEESQSERRRATGVARTISGHYGTQTSKPS